MREPRGCDSQPIRMRIARVESDMLVCPERGRWHPIELSDRCDERFKRGG